MTKYKNFEDSQTVIIVSGLPRSGTSMMMGMLERGGIPVLTDNLRTPDNDNPRGYYEFEPVKKLPKGDNAWLKEAGGKAVKVISALLLHLPANFMYRVIFMHREMSEVLASQRKMLASRREDPSSVGDEKMAGMFRKHLSRVDSWIDTQRNIKRINVSYNNLLEQPASHVEEIAGFLDTPLDLRQMITAVDQGLYRQRKTGDKI